MVKEGTLKSKIRKAVHQTKAKPITVRPLTPSQLSSALNHLLTSTLALYIVHKAQKPTSAVIADLVRIEMKAGELAGMLMQLQSQNLNAVELEGVLAGAFSFIPYGASQRHKPNKSIRDTTAEKTPKKPRAPAKSRA